MIYIYIYIYTYLYIYNTYLYIYIYILFTYFLAYSQAYFSVDWFPYGIGLVFMLKTIFIQCMLLLLFSVFCRFVQIIVSNH